MAYTEENAFELIQSAHDRGRLGHAFLIMGDVEAGSHRLAARMVHLVNRTEEPKPRIEDGFDLFGETPSPQPQAKEGFVESIDELESELVRVLRPEKKSRIINVDAMREFEKSFYTSAPEGQWNVGIIESADRMNDSSANAFLKTLEEPPNRTLLILVTDKPERLLPTILSRCVNIQLIHHGSKTISEAEIKLLQSIATHCKQGFESDISALKMKAVFASILAERKADIAKAYDQALRDEEALYKKTTDGNWLKDREDYYKALTESDYLLERGLLIDTLVSWFGDIIRHKCGHDHLDYPQISKITKELADSESNESLLLRMNSLEELRESLNTNAAEQLALEVGFMKAFG